MKISRDYTPISLTLETQDDLVNMLNVLHAARIKLGMDFDEDCEIDYETSCFVEELFNQLEFK
jgi:hypothetical protein